LKLPWLGFTGNATILARESKGDGGGKRSRSAVLKHKFPSLLNPKEDEVLLYDKE
jgi:hypothetical protein